MMFVLAADYVDLYIAKHSVWPQTIVLVSVCVILSVPCSQFFFYAIQWCSGKTISKSGCWSQCCYQLDL